MWQERFEEMQAKVNKFLIGYKHDFDIDKETIMNAPDSTYLWMLRKTGTQLVNLDDIKNGELKMTETYLYHFYEMGVQCQLYLVSQKSLKRLTKKKAECYLKD